MLLISSFLSNNEKFNVIRLHLNQRLYQTVVTTLSIKLRIMLPDPMKSFRVPFLDLCQYGANVIVMRGCTDPDEIHRSNNISYIHFVGLT